MTGAAEKASGAAHLLLVCTANQGRSAMAEALLETRLAERGLEADVTVGSAGLMEGGVAASPPVQEAVRPYGADLDEHLSRRLDEDMVADADLVVALAGEQARAVLALEVAAWSRTFTLKELVRVAEAADPRRPDEAVAAYLARLDRPSGWRSSSLPSESDDVADPYGQPVEAVAETAAEIYDLVNRLVVRIWPG